MKILVLALLTVLCACGNTIEKQQQTSADLSQTDDTDMSPPAAATDYIKNKLSGWEIATTADYASLWWSFYSRSDETTCITADFNDDAKADYAMLVKSTGEKRYKLVFLVSDKDGLKHYIAPDFEAPYSSRDLQFGVFVEPPGRIDVAYPEIKSLILKSNAIALRNFEVSQRIYYWEDGGFKVFTMGRS